MSINNTLTLKRVLSCSEMARLKAVFIDLSGTLHVDNDQTPGAAVALQRLRKSDLSIRFVTNTTKESSKTLFDRLINIGFELNPDEIFSSLNAAKNYVRTNNLNPFYILSSDALTDFPPVNDSAEKDAVVVGLSPKDFHYDNMNTAFSILLKKHPLIAIHEGKYYKTSQGIAVGPGCFTRGLEYAAGTKAIIVGKPNPFFFKSALPPNVQPEECCMIGDDPRDDIEGAMKVGMKGILVRTGKYRADVAVDPPPTATLDNFAAAVDWLFERNFTID
ncbi:haloacid dehalogenase-like hydrolase domain-containing protein 2 [Bradysia coprophila]|uniref:haloacid dehalogenase-like hydrolase domain-containing protein 2 n=1 Tax=Bradysia coprophila TaxID=38358 RepID=UPI00187D76D9|nr:haloacid dehalogenase-like hydrolase domain-containing protein 2 [Bradysia coprophila]